jgi:predicted HicB family RNase H-like nuclease
MSNFDPHRYTITIKLVTLEEGEHFEAVVAELPDLVEYGETYDQAYSLAVDSISTLREAALEQGRAFPEPMPSQALEEFSGRVTLRMSKSLHASVSKLADREGVSLNSWIVEAISGRAGAGVSIVAVENAYRAESVRAFKVVFSKALGALAQATTWTKLTPYVLESNQVIELKGVSAQQMSTTELANPMRMQ